MRKRGQRGAESSERIAYVTYAVRIDIGLLWIGIKRAIISAIGNTIAVIVVITHISNVIAIRISLIEVCNQRAIIGAIVNTIGIVVGIAAITRPVTVSIRLVWIRDERTIIVFVGCDSITV